MFGHKSFKSQYFGHKAHDTVNRMGHKYAKTSRQSRLFVNESEREHKSDLEKTVERHPHHYRHDHAHR